VSPTLGEAACEAVFRALVPAPCHWLVAEWGPLAAAAGWCDDGGRDGGRPLVVLGVQRALGRVQIGRVN
jgi:hypothetical protein